MDNNFEYESGEMEGRSRQSMASERGGGDGSVDKRKYKILKKALKEQIEFRANIEAELMTKIKKIEEQQMQVEELKESNMELYSKNTELEEVVANLKQLKRMNDEGGQTDEEHMKEILGAQTLLREEMKEKELFKEQVQLLSTKITQIEDQSYLREKQIMTDRNKFDLEMSQLEKKNQKLHDTSQASLKLVEEKDGELKYLQTELRSTTSQLVEANMSLLKFKSQIIERDGNIRDLLEKLQEKGEETAELSSRLIELKNYILDQQVFESKYQVTRVPISTIVWNQNLKQAVAERDSQVKDKKASNKLEIERKELIVSFVQDKSKYGEYFVQLESPQITEKSEDLTDLLKSKENPEKKLIPALDIKSLETVDALNFSIILHQDCLLNCYDVAEPKQNKKVNRASSLITAFGSLMNGSSSACQAEDGGFPMAFESDHVPAIIQCFQKVHSLAFTRQQELNQRWESAQKTQQSKIEEDGAEHQPEMQQLSAAAFSESTSLESDPQSK